MNKTIELKYQQFEQASDLDPDEQTLLAVAKNTLGDAYAPYSGFQVAASILLENGKILVGTNQENASYGLCLCAEQNVLAVAGSQYKDLFIRKIAITARSRGKIINYPVTPCGACRQVISEYEDRHRHPIRIIMQGESGQVLAFDTVKDLLPFSFSGSDLG